MIISRLLFLLIFALLCEGNRRRRLLRVGVQPDPPLAPFTITSDLYISYTNFLRGFIKSQGIFNQYAPIPSNSTYATFMNSVAADGEIEDKNELSLFMAHVLVSSKGLVHSKKQQSMFDELTRNYNRRGYLGIEGTEDYKQASLDIYKDLRLLETPELVAQDQLINWKVSLWNWKRCASTRIQELMDKTGDYSVVGRVYTILKTEWDPKSESYQ
jgi:hypothetical protein